MRLIYVTDPMCSWCYGFGPRLVDLRKRLADTLGVPAPATVIIGGPRPGQRGPVATDKRDGILHHWHAVAERSGMPFDQSPAVAMRRDGFVYDTEPTYRAVVIAREHWAKDDKCVLIFFHAIQHAFYGEGRDTIQTGALRGVALTSGVEAEHFDAVFDTDALRDETREDSRLSRRWGATGFPSLPTERGDTLYQIGHGYVPPVALYARAVEVLQQHPTPDASQYVCPLSNCDVVCVA